jgi:hypothetical protein
MLLTALAFSVVALASGCRAPEIASPLPGVSAEQRAAQSFVHCVEGGTSGCVATGDKHTGWDALHLMLWLATGSPLAVLDTLPAQLAAHADPRKAQAAFVDEVERYAISLRGAECAANGSQPLEQVIERAAKLSATRLERLGMWRRDLAQVVDGLRREAHDELDGGHLVRMSCTYDPFRVYLVTRAHDGTTSVVGMTTTLDPSFGGDLPQRKNVRTRLASDALGLGGASAPVLEGTVDPWMPFPLEDL